jgi:hypothetical protein
MMWIRTGGARHVLCCAALFLAMGGEAAATTLARMSVEQMSQAAQVIVRARCMENAVSWDAGEIWTLTSFDVEEVWRGSTAARITVRLLGGRVGNLTSSVSGIPRFRPGEEVVLFLEATQRGDFSVVSWEQGTFRIGSDVATGRERVTQGTASFATFDPSTRNFEATGIKNMPVETLRARVAAALRAETGGKQ